MGRYTENDVSRLASAMGYILAKKPKDEYAIYTFGLEFKIQGSLSECVKYLGRLYSDRPEWP